MIDNANLIAKFTQKDIFEKRLSDYQFLGEGKLEEGIIQLHFKHPEHGVIYGYLDLWDKLSDAYTGDLEFKKTSSKFQNKL